MSEKSQVYYSFIFRVTFFFIIYIRFRTLTLSHEYYFFFMIKTKLFVKSFVSIVCDNVQSFITSYCLSSFFFPIVFNECCLFSTTPASYICSYRPTLCPLSSACLTFILTDIYFFCSFVRSFFTLLRLDISHHLKKKTFFFLKFYILITIK